VKEAKIMRDNKKNPNKTKIIKKPIPRIATIKIILLLRRT